MEIEIIKTGLKEIEELRSLFLQENNFQFVHNKCHLYGWADEYLFSSNGIKIGYGSVWGQKKREDRDAIFEFYIIKPYRKFSNNLLLKLYESSKASFIECQSNDLLLSSMLYEYSQDINAEAILFEDDFQTNFEISDVTFQRGTEDATNNYDVRYILKLKDEVVATGGLMLNYNLPYADLYYEVNENYRRRGLGSFMVQELKKEAYRISRVPAARCNITNTVSKATLLKAGFKVCGNILKGTIKQTNAKE